MRQHFRLAHPVEYNRDLEGEALRPKRRLSQSNLDEEAALQLAHLEAAYTGRTTNIYLASVTEEFTIKEIAAFRKGNKEYHDTVRDIRGLLFDPNPRPDTPKGVDTDDEDRFVFEETIINTQGTEVPGVTSSNLSQTPFNITVVPSQNDVISGTLISDSIVPLIPPSTHVHTQLPTHVHSTSHAFIQSHSQPDIHSNIL